MTPAQIEAMTAFELMSELGNQITWSATNARFLISVRDAIAHAARQYPSDAAENPHGLAHDIASGTDWVAGSDADGGEDWHWTQAFALAKILLDAYTPVEMS